MNIVFFLLYFVVKSSIVCSSSGKSHEGALLVAKTATVRTFFFAKIAELWILICHHVSPKYVHTKIIDTPWHDCQCLFDS